MVTYLFIAALLCCFVWVFLKWGTGVEHFWRRGGVYTLPPNVGREKRRTERLSLVVPIHVSGQDVSGEAFEEETHTKNISGHGASIVLNRQLRPGQEIVISRGNKPQMATCRVVYEMERREGIHTYGVTFVDPSADIWGVCNLLTEAMAAAKPKN
jgi:hypothetical protein